jgi:hypothetical protein
MWYGRLRGPRLHARMRSRRRRNQDELRRNEAEHRDQRRPGAVAPDEIRYSAVDANGFGWPVAADWLGDDKERIEDRARVGQTFVITDEEPAGAGHLENARGARLTEPPPRWIASPRHQLEGPSRAP